MSRYIPSELRQRIREQFSDRCAYCHTYEHLTVAIFEVEHIKPIAAGGKSTEDNLCLACPTCNRYKWKHELGVDPETNRSVPLFNPRLDKWENHFAWSKGKSEIIGLTEVGRATIFTLKMNREQLIRVRQLWVKLGEHP